MNTILAFSATTLHRSDSLSLSHTSQEEIQALLEALFNAAVPVLADKEILVNVLYSAKQNNENYLDIINSLHDVRASNHLRLPFTYWPFI